MEDSEKRVEDREVLWGTPLEGERELEGVLPGRTDILGAIHLSQLGKANDNLG